MRTFSTTWREGPVRTPGMRLERGPTHENPGFEVTWVDAGAIAFDVARGRVGAAAGACVLVPPSLRNTPWGRGSMLQVMLAPPMLEDAARAVGGTVPSTALELPSTSRITAVASVIAREARHVGDDDPGLDALVHALAIALVRADAPARRALEPAIRRALDYLVAHHADPIRIDDLARVADLPRFVFLRRFRAQVGDSPYRYLTGVRLDRAAAALRDDDRSVLAIALDCGFTDPGRFARAFAARFGCTPRAWRARSA